MTYLYYIYNWAYLAVRAPDFRTILIVKRVPSYPRMKLFV